jgi:hypothetical protein
MDGDDDDQGHSINDDYRMADLPGDDESDLEADREELFGAVPPIPIDVDAEDVGPGDNPVADVVDDGVDAKSALNANHTASRTKLASHAQRANDVPVNFS